MDRAEYKIKLEEINSLAKQGDFKGAAKVADDVDWKSVKSARTLCMIGEIYEASRRYNEALQVLKYAYRRSAQNKTVLYRLSELSIRMREIDAAKRYKREFEEVAPNDASVCILQYKMQKAQNASLDDQIHTLVEYKKREYTERWAYELAKLYGRNGEIEKCINECDDMILWFADGKYIIKAMELKMQFRPLTATQRAKYEGRNHQNAADHGDTQDLSGMEKVEKAVNEAAESESEMERLDEIAQGPDFDPSTVREQDENFILSSSEKLQSKLASGIQAIFSGMHTAQEEKEPKLKINIDFDEEPKPVAPKEPKVEEKKEEPYIPSLEPESQKVGQVVEQHREFVQIPSLEPEREEDKLEKVLQPSAAGSDLVKNGQVDLNKLFEDTGSSLADEVASGQYVLADTLEQERPKEETVDFEMPDLAEILKKEEKPAAQEETSPKEVTEEVIVQAADEALEQAGLETPAVEEPTAEEPKTEEQTAPSDEAADAQEPEDAAQAVEDTLENDKVLENAAALEEDETKSEEMSEAATATNASDAEIAPEEDYDLPEEDVLQGSAEDDLLLKEFNEDEAIQKALLADESEMRKLPEDASEEALMNLSSVPSEAEEVDKAAIEQIMEEPEVFTKIPVEARKLTEDERKVLSYFASIPGIDYQVTMAIADVHNNAGDKTSRSGNIIIMGRQGSGKTRLAEGLILAICQHLNLKAAKTAVIVADEFNKKDPAAVVKTMSGGFLVIEAAGSLSNEAIDKMNQAMEFRTDDLVVILEDEKADIRKMLVAHPEFAKKFTSSITVPVFMNDELVTFGKTYAKECGYKLDELATLALYTKIGNDQKAAEPVTVGITKDMIDRAIERHKRRLHIGRNEKSPDGRIILKEKDFS